MLHCGKIVNTHGVTGETKMLFYTDSADFFSGIKSLYKKDGTPLEIISCRPHKGALIVRFDGIDTMEKAEMLRGCDVYVRRKDAPALPQGRYYISDIIGLEVVTDEGRTLGKVSDVFQTGSNDVYTVKSQEGREYLIPVIDDVVLNVDIEGGKILVKLLKGLIDDED